MIKSTHVRRAVIGSVLLITACKALAPEKSSFPSPDGKLEAVLLDDLGAGAATSAYQQIELRSGGASQIVFEGENMDGRSTSTALFGPLNVSWADSRTLLIEFCDGRVVQHVPRVSANGVPLTIKLVRAQRGEWPSSIPRDRRMGGPPCNASRS